MKTYKDILKEIDTVPTDTDSMFNRQVSVKKVKDGESIQQMLGLDDNAPERLTTNPISMMDLVMQAFSDSPHDTFYHEKDEDEEPSQEDQQSEK